MFYLFIQLLFFKQVSRNVVYSSAQRFKYSSDAIPKPMAIEWTAPYNTECTGACATEAGLSNLLLHEGDIKRNILLLSHGGTAKCSAGDSSLAWARART